MAKTPIFAALSLILLLTMTAAAQAAPPQSDSHAYGYSGVISSGTAHARHHAQRSTRPVMPHVPAQPHEEDPLAYMHFE